MQTYNWNIHSKWIYLSVTAFWGGDTAPLIAIVYMVAKEYGISTASVFRAMLCYVMLWVCTDALHSYWYIRHSYIPLVLFGYRENFDVFEYFRDLKNSNIVCKHKNNFYMYITFYYKFHCGKSINVWLYTTCNYILLNLRQRVLRYLGDNQNLRVETPLNTYFFGKSCEGYHLNNYLSTNSTKLIGRMDSNVLTVMFLQRCDKLSTFHYQAT